MKTRDIGTFEAKTRLSELLNEVERGRAFYITRHGKRIAQLSPVKKEKPKFGCGKGTFIKVSPDFDAPLEDFKDYMQ